MKYILLLFAASCMAPKAKCCLNLYGEDIHGGKHDMQHFLFKVTSFDQKDIKKNINKLNEKLSGGSFTYQDVSNYGVWMLRAGKYAEGLQLFRELIKDHPNSYQVIQNLGTAYELNGMPDSAFHYIKKGYAINPYSHDGSEWMHIVYLETMVSRQEIDFSKYLFLDTVKLAGLKEEYSGGRLNFNLDRAMEDIGHQLEERLPFTLGKDDLLAKLLTEVGDFYAEKLSVTRGRICYLFARHFTSLPEEKTMLQQRIKRVEAAIERTVGKNNPGNLGLTATENARAMATYSKLSSRKPVDTKGWTFIPVGTLITQAKQG